MFPTLSRHAGLFLLAVSPACSGTHDPSGGAPPASSATIAPDALELDVEQAERDIDVDRNVPAARALLSSRVGALGPDARDEATFAMARASHELGDDEAATVAVEGLLVQHAGDARWPLGEASSNFLRQLLTHEESPPPPVLEQAVVAPVAQSFLRYLSDVSKGPVRADVVAIGGGDVTSERLGTFNVAGALRNERRNHCASCDTSDLDLVTTTRAPDWTSIPALRPRAADALTVVYATLEDRIPERYQELLAMPAGELYARLDHGEAFAVARERVGAPPLVLLAAPATSQLQAVEEALAAQATLPLTPLDVKVAGGMNPTEIQRAVRGDFGGFRRCYEAYLTRAPAAEGRVTASFAIEGGQVTRLHVDVDPALRFPVRPGIVTVVYPISFSPSPR